MEIDRKSVGVLIDELITTSMKCWFAQEKVMSSTNTEDIAKAAKDAQALNARRNKLITAIDVQMGSKYLSPTGKTYE
jgi:hypothetical protein